MKIQHIIPSILMVDVCCCSVVSGQVEPPTLIRGAIITISNGKVLMPADELRAYRKRYKQAPPPASVTIKMGESFKFGAAECYLPLCGISSASVIGLGDSEVDCILYKPNTSSAELLLDTSASSTASTDKTLPMFVLRRQALVDKNVVRSGLGMGAGARIEFSGKEGNTWHGVIRGYLYNPINRRTIMFKFDNSPITITLPAEGEDWSNIGAPAPKAEQETEASSASDEPSSSSTFELTDDVTSEIIRKRLQLIVNNPVDEKLANELYTESVTRLSDGQTVSRERLLENARNLVKNWPRRGVNILAVCRNDYQIELLTVFSYSNNTGKEISGYSKLTLSLNEEGKIIAMNEEITENKGQLSGSMKSFDYKGETTFITID